jgi:FkbM family methyltransferase
MKSLRRLLLEKLVARRPRHALQLSGARLNVCALQIRLPERSPLYSRDGGQVVELPLDDVIAPFVLDHGQWQTEELEFIAAHPPPTPSVLIDVGANVGLITRQLMHRLPQIRAAACFEPHPGNFRLLERNLAHLPHCYPVQAAVGERAGDLCFYEEPGNAGNYSLNPDAMRGREYRTSVVKCVPATEAQLLAPLPEELRHHPVVWKSDTQGFDELIVTSLPDTFWSRVAVGVMELWRIERPCFDRQRLARVLANFSVRRFGEDPDRNLAVNDILAFSDGRDYRHSDLFFARD